MTGGGVLVGLFFLFVIFLIAALHYSSKRWEAESEIYRRQEKVRAEATNVQYSINKYKREVNRAKEILALGFRAMERGDTRLDEGELDKVNLPAYMMNLQSNNIYTLLETVLKTVSKAEDDLLYNIERANARLADYNEYIKAPQIPRTVAFDLGLSREDYDGKHLEQLDRSLDRKIAEVESFEGELSGLISRSTTTSKPLDEK